MLLFLNLFSNESLRMNSEEVEQLEVGDGVTTIPFSLGKSSNVETFEEETPCG
jgi:hypothetical protein